MEICSNCNSENITVDPFRGEIVCTECGVIGRESLIVTEPEWRAYTSEERKMR